MCPIIPLNEKNRIIILANQRTGSSITGKILEKSYPTFYITEPLRYVNNSDFYFDQTDDQGKIKGAINVLINLLNCKMLNKRINGFPLMMNPSTCSLLNRIKPNGFKNVCAKSKNILIKLTKIDLKILIEMHNMMKSDIKTVVLFRDPRAILNSRLNQSLEWCQNKIKCQDPQVICQRIRSNIETLVKLKNIPTNTLNNLVVLRYEDLLMNTMFVSKQLYKRLDLDYTQYVEKYIIENTKIKAITTDKDVPLINQDTIKDVFSWIVNKGNIDLNFVQGNCSDVMQMLGYYPISLNEIKENQNLSINQFISNDFPLKTLLSKHIAFIP